MPVLTRRKETQIVAFLLLFFLAHAALSEECKRGLQVDVRYSCDLFNVTKGSVTHWDNWNTGSNGCSDVSGAERLFATESAAILRSADFTYVGTDPMAALPGDFIVGLKVEKKSRLIAGQGLRPSPYDVTFSVFVDQAEFIANGMPTKITELKSKSQIVGADGVVRTTGIDYTDPTTQTSLNLHCAAKIRDGQ